MNTPLYCYILWFSSKVIGTSEVALRIPSLLAMLAAAWLLYRIGAELFGRELGMIATVLFCLHPQSIFAADNVRPYGFLALAMNLAVYVLLRLRKSDSNWIAATFGFCAALIVLIHPLFAVELPALVVCYFLVKQGERRLVWRQFGIAASTFALASLPTIPGIRFMFNTRGIHVVETGPKLSQLLQAIAPGWVPVAFVVAALVGLVIAAMKTRETRLTERTERMEWRHLWVCLSLALIPILILYGVSALTPIHIFTDRHRLVAVPGVVLCWALLIGLFRARAIRMLFVLVVVSLTAWMYFNSPVARRPYPSWKPSIEFAEKNASVDNATVVMCSGSIESDYAGAKLQSEKGIMLAPISYYKLTVPVYAMPYDLNSDAMKDGIEFLEGAEQHPKRFLALQNHPPYELLNWLAREASGAYTVRKLGVFEGVEVLEFRPRVAAGGPGAEAVKVAKQ